MTGAETATRRPWRLIMQLVGFAVCLGLLGWLIADAAAPENREQFRRLLDAPADRTLLLIGLTALSMVLNGCMFWVVIRPVRRVPFGDIQAVNAVSYLLSNVPLRLGLVLRIAVHHRRNGVPLLTVGGWMGAVAVLMLVGLLPPLAAGFWRMRMDAWWWTVSIGGVVGGAVAVLALARFFSTGPGWRRIERFAASRHDALSGRILRSDGLGKLHEGVHMLADPGAVSLSCILRVADLGVQASRFVVAAGILGASLPFEQAVIATVVYFIIDSVAPTGAIGPREKLTALTMGALSQSDFNVLVLTVSGAEMFVRFVSAGIGLLWLRRVPARGSTDRSAPSAAAGAPGDAGVSSSSATDPPSSP